MGFRAGQEQQRVAEVVCSAEAHPQPPSLGPRPRGPHPGSHLGSHQGLRAPRWPSITSGGGRSPAEWLESASWGPALSRHLRKPESRRLPRLSDILTLPGSTRCCTLSGGTFPNHISSSPCSKPLPLPFLTPFGSRTRECAIYLAEGALKQNMED